MNVDNVNKELERMSAFEILKWATLSFPGQCAASSSFQTQSVPLLHLISKLEADVPVLFLDTGFHFKETLTFRDNLASYLKLSVVNLYTKQGHSNFKLRYGDLYRTNPERCCFLNKVAPLDEALRPYKVWITGIRRDQTSNRKNTPILSITDSGHYKICPIAKWSSLDVDHYIATNDLPRHELTSQGFPSIGCAPCTRRTEESEDPRSGRWLGNKKTECGLHYKLDDKG